MDFVFQTSPYDKQALTPQAACLLEQYTELRSREKMPKMWAATDKLNAGISPDEVRQRRPRRKLLSVINLVLGIVLLVPGLMQPQELFLPLIVGAIAVVVGLVGLIGGRTVRTAVFRRSADTILTRLEYPPSARLVFGQSGIEQDGREIVPYDQVDLLLESDDLFFLTWGGEKGRYLLLQKEDLVEGNCSALPDYILRRAGGNARHLRLP